ncbi:MAG: T9SS type A sorting domain-containing protein [Spirosomataceae bacterium]
MIFTVCWTDPEGTATRASSQTVNSTSPKLINDLDIRISDDSGNTWFPWVLDPANPSQSATIGDNIRDNIEQVFISNPTPNKVYTITVRHKRTLQNNGQPYSLFISGVRSQDCNSAVQILKGKDTTLCGNAQVQLEVKGDNALAYQWLKDGKVVTTTSIPSFNITQEGQYAVKVVGYQCEAQSKPITVKITDLNAKITPAGSINICSGKPVALVANTGSGYRYQWQLNGWDISGQTGPTMTPTESGSYTVKITSDNCTAISEPTQLLSILQRPVISTNTGTVIPLNGSIYLTTNTGNDMTYRWFLNDNIILTATGPRLVATLPGKYAVEISQNGCSITSKTLELTNIPFAPNNPIQSKPPEILIIKENLQLYPNPVINTLTVAYKSDNTYDLDAQIVTMEGIKLSKKLLYDNGDVFLNEFDTSSLPAGYYLIRVSDGRRIITKPFVKQ